MFHQSGVNFYFPAILYIFETPETVFDHANTICSAQILHIFFTSFLKLFPSFEKILFYSHNITCYG